MKSTKLLIGSLCQKDSFEVMAIEHSLTLEKSINEGITLKSLEKEIGASEIIKSITFLLSRLQKNSNVTNKMDVEQLLTLSYDILNKFTYETIQDIILMLKMARQGVFGKTYNRLDSETVFTLFMPQYLEKKAEERETLHRNEKSKPILNEENGFTQIYKRQIERNEELQKQGVIDRDDLRVSASKKLKDKIQKSKEDLDKEFAEEIKNRSEEG